MPLTRNSIIFGLLIIAIICWVVVGAYSYVLFGLIVFGAIAAAFVFGPWVAIFGLLAWILFLGAIKLIAYAAF